jgi:PAS domain S-box-containing protein
VSMFNEYFNKSIRLKFLVVISSILFVSTFVLTTVIGINQKKMLDHSLMTKGKNFASYIAKLSLDPLIMKDYLQLDFFVNEANKDEDILYIIVQDAQGNIMTSQYSSINYRSPRLTAILSELSKDSEMQDIIAVVKKREAVTEFSTPILTGADTIGTVTVCMSKQKIRKQMIGTILFVILLNVVSAFTLGFVLFAASKKIIITPIAELATAAARLAKGDLSTQVNVTTTGEVQMLVDSFNQMAHDLKKTTVSKDYVDNIIRNMIDTLIVASPDGIIRTVNRASCALLGYREEELIGQPIKKIFADDTRNRGRVSDKLIKNVLMKNVEYTYLTKDGRTIPVLLSSSAINFGDATAPGLVCLAVDITDRKRAEDKLKDYARKLQESNEELKAFAYIASHDLRTPLVNMKGFAGELRYALQEINSVINESLPSLGENNRTRLLAAFLKDVPEALGFIDSSAGRMEELISAISKLSRLGRQELKPELIQVQTIVQSVLKDLQLLIEKNGIKVTVAPLPEIVVDRNSLHMIFGSILDNAVKYFRPGVPGEIEITAEKDPEATVFSIHDNGRGIPNDEIPKIFEMFRQVGEQETPGEGVGLACAKILVRRHGGRIWCESTLGTGTTFYFTIAENAGLPDQDAG